MSRYSGLRLISGTEQLRCECACCIRKERHTYAKPRCLRFHRKPTTIKTQNHPIFFINADLQLIRKNDPPFLLSHLLSPGSGLPLAFGAFIPSRAGRRAGDLATLSGRHPFGTGFAAALSAKTP